jgi:NTP pyrophosphatase (non-canonical NTP hydrolase)
MTGNEYQSLALRTANGLAPEQLLTNGVMGMCGEAGECVDMMKKHLFQGHDLDKEHLAKELGDVSWYVAITAHALGYDLDKIFEMNIEKLKARYPEGFDAERSLHRKEGDV